MRPLRLVVLVALVLTAGSFVANADDEGLALPRTKAPPAAAKPEDVVRRFYAAFATSDFATMESLYAPSATWHDTIFSADDRDQLMKIWRFELDPKVGGEITYDVMGADPIDEKGNTVVHVVWRDRYEFIGNPIDHSIDAQLTVDPSGHIIDHTEDYSWSTWAHQAFPLLGDTVDIPLVRDALERILRGIVYRKTNIEDVFGRPSKTPGVVEKLR